MQDRSASPPPSQTPPPPHRRHTTAAKAVIAMLIGLAVAALLSSESLVGLAERQLVGTNRDVALSAARNLHRASSFLSLDRPASALRSALGKDETTYDVAALIASGQSETETDTADPDTPIDPDTANPDTSSNPDTPANPDIANTPGAPANPDTASTPADPSTPPPSNPAQPPTTQPATPLAQGPPSQTPSGTPAPTQNPTASFAPPRDLATRPVTESDPLKLWVGGDSLSLSLTVGFGRVTPPRSWISPATRSSRPASPAKTS